VSLTVAEREYFVLMGPTGSGKSLLVKAVCGLLPIESGTVLIGGRDVSCADPRSRGIGYVPQSVDLFPHLDVERNLLFPLAVRGVSPALGRERLERVATMLGIDHLLGRSPLNLSGGERQKVALGRALIRDPELLILDEPVSALDAHTRREICRFLKRVQHEFGVAAIHICHSAAEARVVSDRVGVLCAGRVVQVGTFADIVARPAAAGVAALLDDDMSIRPAPAGTGE
jgi:ABC-type sugar transport system ATPase subunit